jgi:hypothetical protein
VSGDGTTLYIAEENGQRIRASGLTTGVITTYAGEAAAEGGGVRLRLQPPFPTPTPTPAAGTGSNTGTYLGVAAASANIGGVTHLFTLPNGDLVASAGSRCTFVGIDATTSITYSLAGSGTCVGSGGSISSGVASASTPFGSARSGAVWTAGGAVFLATHGDHRVRLHNLTTGLVETWVNAGGTAGSAGDGGAASSAQLNMPEGLAVWAGGLVIADRFNHRLARGEMRGAGGGGVGWGSWA